MLICFEERRLVRVTHNAHVFSQPTAPQVHPLLPYSLWRTPSHCLCPLTPAPPRTSYVQPTSALRWLTSSASGYT